MGGTTATSTTSNTQSTSTESVLSTLLGGTQSTSSTDILTSVIGALTGSTAKNTIVGTWVYSQPSVQFESENLLAKAGGSIASDQIVSKLQPYYEKIGIKAGAFSITFNSDNTCVTTVNGKTYSGTYTYDTSSNQLQISTTGLNLGLGKCYASVTSTQLALTLDAS